MLTKDEQSAPSLEQLALYRRATNYVAAAMTAGAIICEQGGAMAHLVTVSRPNDVKIVRILH